MTTDLIWFSIYLGMATGAVSVAIIVYGIYTELRNKK